MIKITLSFWYRRHLSSSAFKKREGQCDLFAVGHFQVSLTQNSQYATVAYFEVACSKNSFGVKVIHGCRGNYQG